MTCAALNWISIRQVLLCNFAPEPFMSATSPIRHTGAIVPPIHLAATFVQPGAGRLGRVRLFAQRQSDAQGVRNRRWLDLESGCGALAFASGMAAIHCVTMLLEARRSHPGRQPTSMAAPIACCTRSLNRAGIGVDAGRLDRSGRARAAITPQTKLLWIESPGNPLLSITDIAACAAVAHRHGLLLAVDSTFATPVLTRPLELGADIVMHSATKYIGGHSDVLGGALVVRDPRIVRAALFHPKRHRRGDGAAGSVSLLAWHEDAGAARARAMPHGAASSAEYLPSSSRA